MSDGQQPKRDELPLEIEQQIDSLSDKFESAFKKGEFPRIDDFLPRIAPDYVPALLRHLVALEAELRAANDERPGVDEYLARFPNQRAAVVAGLAMFDADLTGLEKGDEPQAQEPVHDGTDPESIGRFQIKRRLGRGGYGVVYLAHDPGLDRLVAVKVPLLELLSTDKARENFLHEARTAAKLKHAALVTVYEVQDEGQLIYIVQEFIEGQNLAQWARLQSRTWEEITRRLIEITTAIGYVHQQGFYHRDLKPGNILIDHEGHAHVADFGLAVHEDAVRMLKGKAAGTPRYMSPEQIRGETHRIDNRTDIWALGVILYELLAGQRPFEADEPLDLYEEIQELDPKSPRTRNPEVPKELERICFKCLAKRRTHRYPTAGDLIEDLEAFLATCSDSGSVVGGEHAATPDSDVVTAGSGTVRAASDSTPQTATPAPDSDSRPPLKIVPKGLRSFDKEDKDFFLELLPGPRDRDGLPDSVRFWKTRIEEVDADATFPVGVMYGPSGCGKSSLVKAGLLPHLAEHVLPVFVEATPNDTELRLIKALRKHVPGLAKEASLSEVLAQLREGYGTEGQKVLLVLDQLEQWLHSTTNMDSSQLVRALRQCDGANVQGLILVRDDFWMSATRFMQALEIRQVEGTNSAAVDLFDPIHARRVLRAFGLAYGRLPEHDLTADQQRFLDRAVEELTDDGKVICVQLSLLADMMKGREWTPASLQEVGGTSGVGVAFLDETFTAKTAPPTHRLHAKAAQAVLKPLLPEVGTDIKGQMQPAERLLECSGYAGRLDDFRDLLQILNSELRLITPTEPDGVEAGETSSASDDQQYYQLTHDYLVPSLREWLTRRQKETRRGRAELKLAERAALWNAKPENRHLPSVFEYGTIRTLTRRRDWTEPQQKMMGRAGRIHAARWGTGLVLALLIVLGIQQSVSHMRAQNRAAQFQNLVKRLDTTIAALATAQGRAVPLAIENLEEFPPDMVVEKLKTEFANSDSTDGQKLAIAYALAEYEHVERPFLLKAIPIASREEVDNLATALAHDEKAARQELKAAAANATDQKEWQQKTRLATVALHLGDPTIAAEMLRAEPPKTVGNEEQVRPELDWGDPPLDPNWSRVNDRAQAEIENAHGVLTDRFAYCLDMPWTTFREVVESLRACKYRPTRLRPFVCAGERRVAALWTRDAVRWQPQYDLTSEELPSPESPAEKDGLVPEDVAAYVGDEGTTLYCILWAEPAAEDEKRGVRVGVTKEQWQSVMADMRSAGLSRQLTLQVSVSADGERRYAGIWSTKGPPTDPNPYFPDPGDEIRQLNWLDISLTDTGARPHPLELVRQQLATLNQLPPEEQATPAVRLSRAKARYYLDELEEALRDLDELVASESATVDALLYCALCRARLGEREAALNAMKKIEEMETAASYVAYGTVAYGQILTHAWLGDMDAATGALQVLVAQNNDSAPVHYNAACTAAQLTRILKESDPDESAAWRKRSLEWLRRAYAIGYRNSAGIENDPDFAPLYDDAEFQTLVQELVGQRHYAGICTRDSDVESCFEIALSLEDQPTTAQQRIEGGFRPVAVACNVLSGQSEPQCVVIWQRPKITPTLQRPWDPVQRTMFIEHFPKWSGSVEKLVSVVDGTSDASLRSGMALALGSTTDPTAVAKSAWEPVLSAWHTGEIDSGLHSASGWALRSWELESPEVPKGERDGFNWYVSERGLTMIRIPAGQVERPEGQASEEAKTIQVENDFWLSDREVTAGLFLEFLGDEKADRPPDVDKIQRRSQGDPSLPVGGVSWYDAVMFCNWLSLREGRDPCYGRNGKEQIPDYDGTTREYDAWELIPDANGFRLPTEYESEYACRAGTTTAFSFGVDEDMLDRYAVFAKNAKGGPAEVGLKLCNAWGLFDMHGNVWEWCQDGYGEGSRRGFRGGCWDDPASFCQSAYRNRVRPNYRYFQGFRVAIVVSGQ